MMRLSILILFLASSAAHALPVATSRGHELAVCRAVERALSDVESRAALETYGGNGALSVPDWKAGTLFHFEDRPFHVDYATTDIDNDGQNDLVIRNRTTIRSAAFHDLYVLPEGTFDLSKRQKVSSSDLQKGLIRRAGSQFTYLAVSAPMFVPFQFAKVNYVLAFDDTKRPQYGERFPILVLKYTGKRIVVSHNVHHGSVYGNDAEVICVYEQ